MISDLNIGQDPKQYQRTLLEIVPVWTKKGNGQHAFVMRD